MSMFCFQCQETAKGTGCTIKGVCGKTDDVANLQDLLIYVLKGISFYSTKARECGIENAAVNHFIMDGLFVTITNANFDRQAIIAKIKKGLDIRSKIALEAKNAGLFTDATVLPDVATWVAVTETEFDQKARTVGVLTTENEDIRSLRELLIYGIKGMAAYAEHAYNLGFEDGAVHAFLQKGLVSTLDNELGVNELVALVLECGQYGVQVMALLDKANTASYGNPEITKVNLGVGTNPGILISGHDLKDMEELLAQTEGTGVDVYTHSEMLPAHYYPKFKQYKHFVGNYGSSWWHQRQDFETFNGPVLFTTNCIVPPLSNATYTDRIYTRENGGKKDFSTLIAHAKQTIAPTEIETGEIVGGFAHNQVLALADKIVEAVKSGAIRKFFVMAGCDGRMKDRNYYTEFAEKLPKDTVILTAGCAKYRYNKLPLGDINGIPRVLDAGQCNDSYSLAVIALKLKEVFELNDINDLPIAYNIAWYEQKAVIVLLALLSLGVKKIHLGPTLPAFLSPNVVNVLVENFGISGITTADEDMKIFLNN
jgi:hydroxylamine reductase